MKNIEPDGVQSNIGVKANLAQEVLRRNFREVAPLSGEPHVPESADAETPQRKRAVSLRASSRFPRILVVEDNWDHAYLALKALTADSRYQVELASSGAEALYKLNNSVFALVLVDYCLSGMNGLNLIRKIKELGQDIPIIMITGLGSESVAVEAMKMGAYDYVIKSGSYLTTLPMSIDKALERYELKKVKEQWDHWVLKRNRELGALSELGGAINQSLDIQTVITVAVEKCIELLGADYGCIQRISAETQDSASAMDPGMAPRMSSLIREVAESGEPIVMENLGGESDESAMEQTRGVRSSIYIPLRAKQQTLGVLVVGSRKRLQYNSQEMMFYLSIGNLIATSIENAQLYETLKVQAERLVASEAQYRRLAQGSPETEAQEVGSHAWSLQSSS